MKRRRVIGMALVQLALMLNGINLVPAQDEGYYTVSGRVVDQNGNGFADAGVCLEPIVYKSQAFDRFVECIGTESDGRFAFKRIKNESTAGKDYFLFVSVENNRSLSTVTPPFDLVREFDRSFDGKKVRFESKSSIELGDLGVQFWYGTAALTISQTGLSRSKTVIDWPNVWLRILNKSGNVVYLSTLSREDARRYVKGNGTRLNVSLPEGKWKVELLTSPESDHPIAYSPYFEVERGAEHNVELTADL
ncbi:MAG TPA: hypothetical protein VHL50_05695 [Pyrinomonadaceae bacterium]|nr:hypothetical protein [Pyrinomonadaceae bacterium]